MSFERIDFLSNETVTHLMGEKTRTLHKSNCFMKKECASNCYYVMRSSGLERSVGTRTYDIFCFLFDWSAHLERYILLKTPLESVQWFQGYEQLKCSQNNRKQLYKFIPFLDILFQYQCCRLATDPARSQHIIVIVNRSAWEKEWYLAATVWFNIGDVAVLELLSSKVMYLLMSLPWLLLDCMEQPVLWQRFRNKMTDSLQFETEWSFYARRFSPRRRVTSSVLPH